MSRTFSKRFFQIPIRMYKADDVEEHFKRKEDPALYGEEDDDIEYVIGHAKILPYDILEWFDCFSRPRTLEEVRESGFDSTRIKTKSGEIYDCVWSRAKFEKNLDAFVSEMEEEDLINFDSGKEEDLKL